LQLEILKFYWIKTKKFTAQEPFLSKDSGTQPAKTADEIRQEQKAAYPPGASRHLERCP
jgi:hypothetical protein